MSDDEYKRLMRRFTVGWFLLLALIILFMIISQRQANGLRNYIDHRVSSELVSQLPVITDTAPTVKGDQGLQGEPGPKGDKGDRGADGIQQQTTVLEASPAPTVVNGKDGANGLDGRTPEIQVNPVTGDLETRYHGDEFWQVLLPCVKLLVGCGNIQDGTITN